MTTPGTESLFDGSFRGLTLTQPWASLVAVGAKRIETRSWSTPYRGPLAIHAAKGLSSVGGAVGLHALVSRWPFSEKVYAEALPLGAIVATAVLRDIWTTERIAAELERRVALGSADAEFELGFGDYSSGRFGWILGDVEPLPEPIPCKGSLGLWNVAGALGAAS